MMSDIDSYLKETYEDYFDVMELYPEEEIIEFSEIILGPGCYQKKKKRIYDQMDINNEY